LRDPEKQCISNAKEDIGKFLSSNKDILDKPFLVYWVCVDDSHWISIIGINLSHSDEKTVCGFIVLDSLQDEHGRNKLPRNSGFRFLLNNLCQKNVDDDSIEPYGQFDCVKGEENFRQFYFMNESLLPQKGCDCACAMILNSIGLVMALSQKDHYKFLINECVLKYDLLSDNCTATLPACYNLAAYWKLFPSTGKDLPRGLRYEVITLCDRLAHVEHHVQVRNQKNKMLLQKIRNESEIPLSMDANFCKLLEPLVLAISDDDSLSENVDDDDEPDFCCW